MSAGDLPRLSTMALHDFLGLSVLVRDIRLVRVPCLALTCIPAPPTSPAAIDSPAVWS